MRGDSTRRRRRPSLWRWPAFPAILALAGSCAAPMRPTPPVPGRPAPSRTASSAISPSPEARRVDRATATPWACDIHPQAVASATRVPAPTPACVAEDPGLAATPAVLGSIPIAAASSPTPSPRATAAPRRAASAAPTMPGSPAPGETPVPGDPAAAALVQRINQARHEGGQPALAWAAALAQAAQAHGADMVAHGFFSHTGSDNSDVRTRIARAGYRASYWGETLTHVAGGPGDAFTQFWDSPPHRDILLGSSFTEVGAAMASDPAAPGFAYWVVVFASR